MEKSVKIDEKVYAEIEKHIQDNLNYATLKQFVSLACDEKIKRDKIETFK